MFQIAVTFFVYSHVNPLLRDLPLVFHAETILLPIRITFSNTLSLFIKSSVWWYMPVVPATQEVEVEGSWSKNGPGKSTGSYLKNKPNWTEHL
jgi:hypothetical protein